MCLTWMISTEFYPGTYGQFRVISKTIPHRFAALTAKEWGYMVIWECEIKEKNLEPLWERIKEFLNG